MALEADKIKELISRIIPELKNIDNAIRKNQSYVPKFYPTYPIAVDYAERIAIHAEVGKFPEKLFLDRSPNQEEKEFNYVKKNYKQVTLPIFVDYLSTITRPFHDANWSIDYKDQDEKVKDFPFQKYIEEDIEIYGSVENFVKFIVSQRKAVDANGVIAIKPHKIDTIKSEDGDDIIDPNSLNKPMPFYYESKQVVAWENGEYVMIMLNEKSFVDYAGKREKIGFKFELYDNENIWIIEQVGKFIDYQFSIKLYFNHDLGYVPVKKLMGVPQIIDGNVVWQSPFLYVTDILDLVTLNSSNLQMSINNCVYPYRVMIGDVCEWKDGEGNSCTDGTVTDVNMKSRPCPSCNGTGLKSRISPLGTMLLKPATRLDQGDSTFTQKPLEYISPDVTTLQFLENKIAKDLDKSRKILHLQTSNSDVVGTENLTATGMAIDVKAMYAFVKTISDQTFHIFEFIVDTIGEMRYGKSFKAPKITFPTTFDFVTEQDIIAQLKSAVDGGLPPFVIHSIIYRYLQTLYFSEEKTASIFNLIVKTDRLLTLSNEEVALKLARGTVHDWEEILHTSAINFVNELIDENPNFLKLDMGEQSKQLIAKAQSIPCASGTCSIGGEEAGKEGIDSMVEDLSNEPTSKI